jgi:hypothetical protein
MSHVLVDKLLPFILHKTHLIPLHSLVLLVPLHYLATLYSLALPCIANTCIWNKGASPSPPRKPNQMYPILEYANMTIRFELCLAVAGKQGGMNSAEIHRTMRAKRSVLVQLGLVQNI